MSNSISGSVGVTKEHRISRKIPNGYQIETEAGAAFLSEKEAGAELAEGDTVNAFIFHDYEGHLTATLTPPFVQAGQCDILRVKAAGPMGAFADWGLAKDLLIPHAHQSHTLKKGEYAAIYVFVDTLSGRVAGSMRIDKFLQETSDQFSPNQEVELLVFRQTEIGYLCAVNQTHTGMLYASDLMKRIKVPMKTTGYIQRVRDDQRLDLTLRRPGYQQVRASKDVLMDAILDAGGFLDLHDKSRPEEVKERLEMSKKVFKAAAGGLLKEGKIKIEDNGLRAVENE